MDADARITRRNYDATPEARAAVFKRKLRSGEQCARCKGQGGSYELVRDDAGWPVNTFVPCPACVGLSPERRIALAAYCGDEAAMLVCGEQPSGPQPMNAETAETLGNLGALASMHKGGLDVTYASIANGFVNWFLGIARWGVLVTMRASCAAARAAAIAHHDIHVRAEATVVITAAEAYLNEPTEARRQAWEAASAANTPDFHPVEWQRDIARLIHQSTHAAIITGYDATRGAVERALVAWALDGLE